MVKTQRTRPTAQRGGSKTGHDVFGTPENNIFLSTNPYIDLNPLRKEIRLLKVLSGGRDGQIVCELQQGRPLIDIRELIQLVILRGRFSK